MRTVRIPKRRGSYRTIYVPSDVEKQQLRNLLPDWHRIAERLCHPEVVHGFMKRKSPITNALLHRGYQYTLNFDLQDFFDSVTRAKLWDSGHHSTVIDPVLVDGVARQGLPTSPLVANVAAVPLDDAIALFLHDNELTSVVRYTRYADDLTFSFNLKAIARTLQEAMPDLVQGAGFQLAEHKTRLYCASNGRRMITGVAVDEQIHPTRRAKRRLRAAQHRNNYNQIQGLQAWVRQATQQSSD